MNNFSTSIFEKVVYLLSCATIIEGLSSKPKPQNPLISAKKEALQLKTKAYEKMKKEYPHLFA